MAAILLLLLCERCFVRDRWPFFLFLHDFSGLAKPAAMNLTGLVVLFVYLFIFISCHPVVSMMQRRLEIILSVTYAMLCVGVIFLLYPSSKSC